MKRAIGLIFIGLLFLSFGCVEEEKTIVVFNQPLKSIVERIVEDKIRVVVLAEGDPHLFQLTPKKSFYLSSSLLYIGISRDLEGFSPEIKAIYLEDVVEDKIITDEEVNPHYWTNPEYMLRFSEIIGREIIGLDEENKEFYQKNLEELKKELEDLDGYLLNLSGKKKRNKYVITHPSMVYFDKRYGLTSYPIFTESTTSPKRIDNILEKFKQGEINLIARETQIPEERIKFLKNMLDDNGIEYKVVEIDVLGINEKDYIKMMKKNGEVIFEELSK